MTTQNGTPQTPPEATESAAQPADARRRAALRQLGRGAAYAIPTTVSLMMMKRAAAAS